jgi:2-oxo-3-hexenedioate decarboxylase
MLQDETVRELAETLDAARLERREVERLTVAHPSLDLDDAYAIQRAGVTLRQVRGEVVVGWKMGLTSKAKREQMNLTAPVYGVLTDAMQVRAAFQVGAGIHPKIEPEIAFLTGHELHGQITREEAAAAVTGVCAAMEILDSRYVGFQYFSLPDVVADNSSSSHFVVPGVWQPLADLDLGNLTMTMHVDGVAVQSARSDAISGHPLESLVQLVAMLAAHGQSLPAGSLVLAGAATVAEKLKPGMVVRLDVTGLASVAVTTV